MYRALESFTTKNYDVKRKQILDEDFTTQEEINELLNIGYIELYDGTIEIIENGNYDVKDYDNADVNVQGQTVNLEEKDVTVTSNGESTINPSEGYNGISKVNLTTNVPTGITPTGTINITQNGSDINVTNYANADVSVKYAPSAISFFTYNGTDLTYETENLDTSNIQNMSSMFGSCLELTTLNLSGFDTSNVTDMSGMFSDDIALQSLDVSSFDTSNVTNMAWMFNYCESLTTIIFGNNFTFGGIETYEGLEGMFSETFGLDDNTLNAILHLCTTVGQSYTGSKKLTTLGITDRQAYPTNRITALSNYQDFVNAGWSIS